MRENWERTTLSEIAEINPEKVPKWSSDHLIKYLDIAAVNWGKPVPKDIKPQRFGSAPGRARRVIRESDVVVSTVRPNLRSFAKVPVELDGEVASTGFVVLRAKQGVEPNFIWALVSHENFRDDLVRKATGSNYPAVRASDVASHQVFLPPVSEQKRIVNLMDAVDDAIEVAEKQVVASRKVASAVRNEMFKNAFQAVDQIPAGSKFDMLLGRQKSARQSVGDHVIPYLRAGNISSDGFLLSNVQAMNFSPREQEKYCLREGDVMLVEGGSLGQSSMWASEIEGPVGFDKHVIRLRGVEGVSSAEYALQWTRWAYETGAFDAQATGVTIRALGFGRAKSMLVPDLVLSDQRKLVEPLMAADMVIARSQDSVDALQTLRSNLLRELLSGGHTIPSSYDELLATS